MTRKVLYSVGTRPSVGFIGDRIKNAIKIKSLKGRLASEFGSRDGHPKADIRHVEHHIAHLGSAFFVSPFDRAAVVSIDGFGDFVGAMWGFGEGNKLTIMDRIYYPHSLGLFYLAMTQYLGFPKYGDEYKVMGLASYGRPVYLDKLRDVVLQGNNGRFKLNLDFFVHHTEGATMTWESGEPDIGKTYSIKMENDFGSARKPGEPLTHKHEDLAASLQARYEEAFFDLLNRVHEKTRSSSLCLAGGCAMNSVANGKIFDKTPFKEVYIQPAAGDAGGAIGAAYYVWHQVLGKSRDFVMKTAYWGPEYSESEIGTVIEEHIADLNERNCKIVTIQDTVELCRQTAKEISLGKVVGWFQGRMEWGPRALGNRSIVADPRRPEMKDVLNSRIKRREPFRPFAPSILLEKTREYFEKDYPDPFMIKVYPIKPEKRSVIPAVTHVDGTGRLQTVRKDDNPLYWQLIKEFENITGIPVVLNTSFNENEPIVCTPEEALGCFLRTRMDVLVLGSTLIKRDEQKKDA
jgi:carbamoyltransferase